MNAMCDTLLVAEQQVLDGYSARPRLSIRKLDTARVPRVLQVLR
eukprot:SAG11_NODE_370_length_10058_cov_108.790943_5_plen_44_part_00